MTDCDIEYGVASFRDIEFEVLPVDETGGRRIVTNQYPFTDNHYNEDLGRKATTWSVRGCFHGDDFRDKLTTAKRVWARPGAGLFFEPTENREHAVTLVDTAWSYDDKKLNYVEFSLSFVEASEEPYPSSLGRRGLSVNTSVVVEDYLGKVRADYRKVMRGVDDFNSITVGLLGAHSFLNNAARAALPPLAFLSTRAALEAATPSRVADENLERTEAIYTAAIDGKAPVVFFKRASEGRAVGNSVVVAQTGMAALIGLGYYFERLAMGAVNFSDLAEFRDRAISLKTALPSIAGAVDALIAQMGTLATDECTRPGETAANALVASYALFGDISRAYEIVLLSNGVSGARMPALVTPCDTL